MWLQPNSEFTYSTRFSWTGYTKREVTTIRDRNVLIDAILTAYDNPAYQPLYKDGKLVETYCNIACNEIAEKYGCNDLKGKTADEICAFMESHPEEWQEILCAGLSDGQKEVALLSVQMWANTGSLVFAIQSSYKLGGSHGHICVCRPGVMKVSGKWGKVPAVCNIGRENFIAVGKSGIMKGEPVGLNEAFIELPRFFVWRGL